MPPSNDQTGLVVERRRRIRRDAAVAAAVLAASWMVAAMRSGASAARSTTVALNFDGNTVSQFNLGYQQALQPQGVNASFYVNSGTVSGGTSTKFMSWSQLSTLAGAGNEIGGKTVDGTNLTPLTAQQQVAEICNDRQTLVQHGLTPFTFAYPGGANNATIQADSRSGPRPSRPTPLRPSPRSPVTAHRASPAPTPRP